MTSKNRILKRIRAATNDASEYQKPPVPQIWPKTDLSQEQLLERFRAELESVRGESLLCASMSQGAEKLAELAVEHRWNKIGVADHPLCHTLTAGLPNHRLFFERSNWAPVQMAELSAGLVAADAFLADTGSALVRCATKEQRLLCYLPPVSIVVAQTNQIVANLPSVWRSISDELRQTQGRGETVIVTGPSRSSDIEKRLVVGVHGPQRVIALLIGCVR